jgi:hypothetical protein
MENSQTYEEFPTKFKEVTHSTCTQRVTNSNLGREASDPDGGFSEFYSVPP